MIQEACSILTQVKHSGGSGESGSVVALLDLSRVSKTKGIFVMVVLMDDSIKLKLSAILPSLIESSFLSTSQRKSISHRTSHQALVVTLLVAEMWPEKTCILSFDGMKIIPGLTKEFGHIELYGFEEGISENEKHKQMDQHIDVVKELEGRIDNMNVQDGGELCTLPDSLKI